MTEPSRALATWWTRRTAPRLEEGPICEYKGRLAALSNNRPGLGGAAPSGPPAFPGIVETRSPEASAEPGQADEGRRLGAEPPGPRSSSRPPQARKR